LPQSPCRTLPSPRECRGCNRRNSIFPKEPYVPCSSAWAPHLEYRHGWTTWDDHRGSSWQRLSRRGPSQMLSTDHCPDDTWGSLKACPSIPRPRSDVCWKLSYQRPESILPDNTLLKPEPSSRAGDSWYKGTTPRRASHSIGKTIYSDYVQSAHCLACFEH
jgi:hypothetical protein